MGVYFPQCTVLLRVRWEKSIAGQTSQSDEISSMPILCKSVKVSINDYTQADTFEIEIDYKNFPFDPRTVRAVGVTIALADAKKVFAGDNSLQYITPTQTGDSPNVIFMGFADEESINFDDTRRTVKLEGRDFTSLLIDKKYTKGAIGLEETVDAVITKILSDLPETQKITIDNQIRNADGTVQTLPILAKFWGEKDLLSGKRSIKKDESYWDVIQDIIRRAGLIAYIELDKLVISQPRAIFDKTKAKKFVYGKNLLNLEFKRKIGRRRGFNVVVRSLNLNSKEVLEAKIPAEATEAWSKATGIANSEVKIKKLKADGTSTGTGFNAVGVKEKEETAPYMAFTVPDVVDKAHLVEVGQQIYEEMARQEIEGSCETAEMSTADHQNLEFPLNQLRNGTPIEIYIEASDMKELKRFYDSDGNLVLPKDRKQVEDHVTNYLIGRGWEPKVARRFSQSYGNFGNIFYTKSVEFTLNNENGFKCKVDFVNFIEIKQGGQSV